jgi:hypothetical protein
VVKEAPGAVHYFGTDWDEALKRFAAEWDDLLSDAPAHTVANSPSMAALRSCDLAHDLVTSDGAIARSPHLARLRFLDLEGAGVGRLGAKALAVRGPNRPAALILDYCLVGCAQAARLARSAAAAGRSVSVVGCGSNGCQD